MSYLDKLDMNWVASQATTWVMTNETIQYAIDNKPDWLTFQNVNFAISLADSIGLTPLEMDGLELQDQVTEALIVDGVKDQVETWGEIAPEPHQLPEQPEKSTEIGGPTVDAQIDGIKQLQNEHEAELGRLHEDRDRELNDQADKDDKRIEWQSQQFDVGAEGMKMLQDAKDANQQTIANRYEVQEAEVKLRQSGELAALQEKQTTTQPAVATPSPAPAPISPSPPPQQQTRTL